MTIRKITPPKITKAEHFIVPSNSLYVPLDGSMPLIIEYYYSVENGFGKQKLTKRRFTYSLKESTALSTSLSATPFRSTASVGGNS